MIGASWDWAGADYAARERIFQEHVTYQQGYHWFMANDSAVPEKVRESIIAGIPAGRLGEPEEIARCVAFLVSDDAGFVNGSTISANGAQFFV